MAEAATVAQDAVPRTERQTEFLFVPRWLSAWGLLAVASVMVSGALVMVRLTEPMSTTQIVLALPIALQEMVLAVWLIAKGFNVSAIAAKPAGERHDRVPARAPGRRLRHRSALHDAMATAGPHLSG